ncbi:restriction endonuclease [Vulcaniibacterium gelatinicum]|uniref:restriction endonuclease n=1 Tax=Vulcaniibacterium gelatinicum TaxID=2598725 RepID=UPI0011CC768F|nr:restriction endonuclease [Vulcaniibacterium gelatinicum]
MTASWLIALLAALALGIGVSAWLWRVRRQQLEAAAGTRALAAMRWREFSHFVLDAMRHRGFDVLTPDAETHSGPQAEFLLLRNGQRWLLACKHGSAYRLTPAAVEELAASVRLKGAAGGLLVTPGTIDPAARRPAVQAGIELVDGDTLWPELVPLLPQALREDVQARVGNEIKRLTALAWAGAVLVAAVLGLLLGRSRDPVGPGPGAATVATAAPSPATAPASAAAPAPTAPAAPAAGQASSPPLPAAPERLPTEQEENAQRQTVIAKVSALPGVDRAFWSTRSTLVVQLEGDGPDRFGEICAALDPYLTLRTARVQLQPPKDSGRPVRFRQCRTF